MLLMSVLYWRLPVALDATGEAAVVWFVSVQRNNSFDCSGGNDCKWQNTQGQIPVKYCSSLDLDFAKSYCTWKKTRDFSPFVIAVYFLQYRWIMNSYMTQESRAGYSMQKWLSSTSAVLTKFITTLFLWLHNCFLRNNCFFLWKQVY